MLGGVYRFDRFGHSVEFRRENGSYLFVKDGVGVSLEEEAWENQLAAAIAKDVAHLERNVATQHSNQDQFVREHRWSFTRATSDWHGGVKSPNARFWGEASAFLTEARGYRDMGELDLAYSALREARHSEAQGRYQWNQYLAATTSGAEGNQKFQGEMIRSVAIAGASGAAAAAALPVGAMIVTADLAAGATIGAALFAGIGAGALTGGVVGGVSGGVLATTLDGVRSRGSGLDMNLIEDVAQNGALLGTVSGAATGGAAAAGVLVLESAVTAGSSAAELASAGLTTVISESATGIATQSAILATRAKAAITSAQFWRRTATVATLSAGTRAAYDIVDMTLLGHQKETTEVAQHVTLVFVGSGLTGGIYNGALAYNFAALDILGDASEEHLTDIREKRGDAEGTAIAGGLLAAENGGATLVFRQLMGRWAPAAGTALLATGVSIGLEIYFQRDAGREWDEIDPGRFVGISVWGHSVVVLPKAILNGAPEVISIATAAARATELTATYPIFVNPSVGNFSAQINDQNLANVLAGDLVRQPLMFAARGIQAAADPTHVVSIVADEASGIAAIAGANAVFPRYEGKPKIWSSGFLERIRSRNHVELTRYLSDEMGKIDLMAGGERMPSTLNLEKATELLADARYEEERRIFEGYLNHLSLKRQRTPQEEKIYRQLGEEPIFMASRHQREERPARAEIMMTSSMMAD